MKKSISFLIVIIMFLGLFTISYVGFSSFDSELIIEDNGEMRIYRMSGKKPRFGMVFYVGTFTQPELYDNIMSMIASAGYLVAIPYQPLNIAFSEITAMDRVMERYDAVDFIISGHSQGGLAATFYANRSPEKVKGIVYYASYPYLYDLGNYDFPCLSIIPSNDRVMNLNDIYNSTNYPEDTTFYVIEGGNHISFASNFYFPDGPLEITIDDQQQQTANQTINFLKKVFSN